MSYEDKKVDLDFLCFINNSIVYNFEIIFKLFIFIMYFILVLKFVIVDEILFGI